MVRSLLCLALVFGGEAAAAASVTFDWARIGNVGNAPDPEHGFGSVDYEYRISKTEVTNTQYVEFLNAVATSDPHQLYSPLMTSSVQGGIERNGVNGNYTYSVKSNYGNKPAIYISYFDAMRFTNWLHNGQGTGDTESGVYEINNGLDEVRSDNARFFIPTIDEWYKAAYHDTNSGIAGIYFDYPTQSNVVPTAATANLVGDVSNPGSNIANFSQQAIWNGNNGNVTTVGSAGVASASPYGTFDQGGNVWEWTEEVMQQTTRGIRGGAWDTSSGNLNANHINGNSPGSERFDFGFRIASPIPEPSTSILAILGLLALGVRVFSE